MKKLILTLSSIAMIGSITLLISSCGKDDTAPVIIVLGDDPLTISLNTASYTDAGATADDNEDGAVTVTSDASATNPNLNVAGTYTIGYSASDKEGNIASATRTIYVVNDADYLVGSYGVNEQPGGTVWIQSITTSTTENNKIIFSKFANYSGNNTVTAKLVPSGSDKYVVLNPASQQKDGIGLDGCNHLFEGNGNGTVKVQQVSGKWSFSIKFKDTTTGGGGTCTVTGALPYEDTFLQQ